MTEIDIPFYQFFRVSALTGTRYKLTLALGRICREALDVYDRVQEGVKESRSGALTPEKIEAYRRLCEDKPDDYIDARQVPFTDAEVANPNEWHSYGAKLLLETLSDRSLGIKSALNVGGYNDRHFAYMAPRFPDIKFTSVDFMSEAKMKAFHRLLPQSPNWGFKSGYALDLIRDGKADADLVFMASTSLLFNNKELDLYCDEFAKRSKVVVINEGWGAVSASSRVSSLSPFPSVIRPEDIPEDASVARSMEGRYYFYAHNYPAKLERRGFNIRLSRLKAIGDGSLYLYQLVAVKGRS